MENLIFSKKALDRMFENPAHCGKYMDDESMFPGEEFSGCMKPIEFFMWDIMKNLIGWSKDVENASVFYKTNRNFYRFSINPEHKGLIDMVCHYPPTNSSIASWANKSSIAFLGKELLQKNTDKFIPLTP